MTHIIQTEQILRQFKMVKTGEYPDAKKIEAIIEQQFRQKLTIDEFFDAYNNGYFADYLNGRNKRMLFYQSPEWIRIRKIILGLYGNECMCCGCISSKPQIDHIIPRYTDKTKELDLSNCQVLCEKCNREKSKNTADYRTPEHLEKLKKYLHNASE